MRKSTKWQQRWHATRHGYKQIRVVLQAPPPNNLDKFRKELIDLYQAAGGTNDQDAAALKDLDPMSCRSIEGIFGELINLWNLYAKKPDMTHRSAHMKIKKGTAPNGIKIVIKLKEGSFYLKLAKEILQKITEGFIIKNLDSISKITNSKVDEKGDQKIYTFDAEQKSA